MPGRGHEIGLLRRIVKNLALKKFSGQMDQDTWSNLGLARGKIAPIGVIGLLRPGLVHFEELSELLFSRSPKLVRGTTFDAYQSEFLNAMLSAYLEKDAASIDETDVEGLEGHLLEWFSKRSAKSTVFVPCIISPWPSPRFSVGTVSFIFRDDVKRSEFYRVSTVSTGITNFEFNNLLEAMQNDRANWLAVLDVDDCDQHRALEIANLAVDLSIVSLQVAAPHLGTKNMCRLAMRRGPSMQMTLALSRDHYYASRSNLEAGLSIGNGYLAEIIRDCEPIITAVGNSVRSFTAGSFRLPVLEQAWCDAAYWFHQGLAEPLDSIAVTKLEAALEVFFGAGSTKKAEACIIEAIEAFFGFGRDNVVIKATGVTVKLLAKYIVRDRSKVLHGDWSTLNVRLASSRKTLEEITTILIRESVVELERYAHEPTPADNVGAFLAWVKARRDQALKQAKKAP